MLFLIWILIFKPVSQNYHNKIFMTVLATYIILSLGIPFSEYADKGRDFLGAVYYSSDQNSPKDVTLIIVPH